MSNPLGLLEPGTPEPDFIDHLYDFEPVEPPSWVRLYLGAHADCWISHFCRNPLHPGPCKGWKKTLAKIAPGAYNALEKDRVDKLNAKRKAKIEALKKDGKPVPPALLKEIKPVPASEAAKGAPAGTGDEAPLSPKREAKIKAVSEKVKEEFDPETVAAKKAAAEAAKEKKAAAAKKAAATKAANKAKKEQEAKAAADAEAAAKGGMSSDDAQAYAEAMGAVVKLGIPQATKKGLKDGIAKTKAKAMSGPLSDDPMVESTIDSMASKIASQAAGTKFGAAGHAKLKEIAKQEIEEMLAAGSADPPAGGLLEALKKYHEAPKGAGALSASEHLNDVAADAVHGPGTSTNAKKVAQDYEEMAKAAGSPSLGSSFKNIAKGSVLDNPKAAVSGGAMLQQAAADKVMKAAKAADPSLTPKQLQALGQAAKDLVASGLKGDGSGDTKPFLSMMGKDGANLAKIAKALTPDDAPTSGPDGPNGTKAKAYATKANLLAGKAGVILSTAAKKAAEDAALKDLDAGKVPGEPGSAYDDAMDLVASDMVADLVAQSGVDMSLSEKLALSDQIAKVLRAASKQGAPTGAASAQLNAIGKLKPAELKAMAQKAKSQSSTDEGSAAPGTDSLPLPGSPEAKAKAGLSGLAKAYGDAFGGDTSKQQGQIMSPAMQKAMAGEMAKGPAEAKKAAAVMAHGVAKAKVEKMVKEKGYDVTPEEQNALISELTDQVADHILAGNDPMQAPLWMGLDSGAKGTVKVLAQGAEKKHGGDAPDLMKIAGMPAAPAAPAATATPGVPNPKAAKKAEQAKAVSALGKHAGASSGVLSMLTNDLNDAIEDGDTEYVEEVQLKIADHLAAAALEDLGDLGLDADSKKMVLQKLRKDYFDAITADADAPGGLAGKLSEIATGANEVTNAVASGNGWPLTSPSVTAYKSGVLSSGIMSAIGDTTPPKKSGSAGAGGPSPATPVTPPPAKSAAAKKAVKAAPAGPISGTTAPVAGITHPGGQIQNDPQGIYPIGQVVAAGHEQEVADYNARVEAGVQGKEAMQVPTTREAFANRATVGAHTGASVDSALYDYTASSGWANNALRNDEANAAVGSSHTAARIRALDSAFNDPAGRIPEAITVLRGFSNPGLVFGSNHRPDSSMVGVEWRDPAYSSSTVNMNTARGFAGAGGDGHNSVVMRVHMPAGTRAIALGTNSAFGSEGEILLNRGARFRIVADNGYQNGARHLDVEVVLDGDD